MKKQVPYFLPVWREAESSGASLGFLVALANSQKKNISGDGMNLFVVVQVVLHLASSSELFSDCLKVKLFSSLPPFFHRLQSTGNTEGQFFLIKGQKQFSEPPLGGMGGEFRKKHKTVAIING